MQEIFDNYVEHSFGNRLQSKLKIKQFEFNYKKYFSNNKNIILLDIGIGMGEMLTCFQNWRYSNHIGIDISPSTIDFCQSIGLNCTLVNDSTEFLKLHQNSYDVITLIDVLEHIPRSETIAFLKQLRSSLKEGGVLIIQVPNLQSPDGHLHMYNDITHVVGYIEHSLQQVLLASGFQNFHFQGFEELIENDWKSLIKRILRKFYWKKVRLLRSINSNLNPMILNPVFAAIVRK